MTTGICFSGDVPTKSITRREFFRRSAIPIDLRCVESKAPSLALGLAKTAASQLSEFMSLRAVAFWASPCQISN